MIEPGAPALCLECRGPGLAGEVFFASVAWLEHGLSAALKVFKLACVFFPLRKLKFTFDIFV